MLVIYHCSVIYGRTARAVLRFSIMVTPAKQAVCNAEKNAEITDSSFTYSNNSDTTTISLLLKYENKGVISSLNVWSLPLA